MKLAISNIAWRDEEEEISVILENLDIKGIEIAPRKISSKLPELLSKKEMLNYKRFWKDKGINIIAMQALLYGKPDLKLFESSKIREKLYKYILNIISIANSLNVKIMVFGSPKNRKRNNLSLEEANNIAIPFFRKIGEAAHKNGIKFCIEHNPPEYDVDYIQTPLEALELVKKVNNPGFGLNIDTGGLILSNEGAETIIKCKNFISHFHISQPFLTSILEADINTHKSFADALRKIGYSNWISIEMRPPNPDGNNADLIRRSINFIKKIYC